jgi:hypothetical protein
VIPPPVGWFCITLSCPIAAESRPEEVVEFALLGVTTPGNG